MDFKTFRKQKFDLGATEHKQPWDREHIDYKTEAKGEAADLANYMDLEPNDEFRVMVQMLMEEIYNRYESHGG